MRGADEQPGSMFSYVSLEDRVPADHPLRAIRRITDRALAQLSPRFDAIYVQFGRPSVAPEKLLRALLLQALYTIRSERQLMERLDFDLLFRWFVGLGIDDPVWSPTTFTKNRDRLLDGDIAAAFFQAVLIHAETARLLSEEHFTVDGTLLEAWASQKSFRPRDEEPPMGGGANPTVNFHGQRRRNATHQSRTDPDARLYKKATGREARLGYLGHVLLEHRSGLIVDTRVTPADGHGERDAALLMVQDIPGRHRITIAADKGIAKDLLASLNYAPGKRYEDFTSSTDKVAEYGLGALIGVVAVKKLGLIGMLGLFLVKVWKLAAVAIAAGAAAVRRFLRKGGGDQAAA